MSIFEQDITQVEPGEVVSLVQRGTQEESLAFLAELGNLFEFAAGLYGTVAISHSLFFHPSVEPIIDGLWEPERWRPVRDRLRSRSHEWDTILSETLFLRAYQSFESFVLRQFTLMYYIFPRFLVLSPDDMRLGQASFIDLYGTSSILQVRRSFIENRVIGEFQAKNIAEAIQSIGRKFGIDLALDPEDFRSLLRKSADRNILVHNHGVVNELYLALLRKNGISVPYRTGERVGVDHDYVNKAVDLFRKLAKEAKQTFLEKAEHIMQYYQGKFGTYP